MFKNLILYQLNGAWPEFAADLENSIRNEPFAPCSATQANSAGWAPPRGHEHGALVEVVDGQWIMQFVIETKTVPADALRRKVQEMAAHIEKTQGRKPGKKELRDMKDDALTTLLPHAFPRQKHIAVWIDPDTRIMAVDAASHRAADEVIASLFRTASSHFGISVLQTAVSPQAAMTNWLSDEEGDALPSSFSIERECELKGSGEQPAVVRFASHPLETPEVRQHIAEGKLPTKLAMSWQGRVGFVLTQTMQLKKIGLMEGVFDDAGTPQNSDERFDADVALFTGEMRQMLPDLIRALAANLHKPLATCPPALPA